MDEYIRETKQRLSEVMGKLGWNPEDLKSAQTYSVCRYDDKHHVQRQNLVKHELLCSLKKQGLTSAEAETAHDTGFCYAESRSVASFSLTHSEIKNVLMSRCTSDRYSLEDLNVHRLLTPAERLALYEYLIEKARFEGKVHNIPEHQLLFLDNEEEKEAAQAGLTLGQLRDLKRRRPSYRAKNVHVTKKSYTERMREVLDNQFKMLEDIRKDPELLALYKKRMAARASSVQPQPNSEASAQRERSESRSRVPEKVSVDDKWQHDKFDPSEGLRDRRSMSRQSDRRHSGEFDPRDPRNARSQSRDGRDFRTDYRDRSRDPARGSQSRDSAPRDHRDMLRDRRESAPPRDHREISRDHRSASRDGSRGDERSRGYEDTRGSSSRAHSASRYEQKMAADEYDDRMAPRDYQRSTSRDHHERSSRDRSSSRIRSHVEVRTEYDVPRSRSRTRSRSHRSDSKHKKRKKESKSRERSVKKKKKKLSDKKSRKRKHRHEEREKRKSKKEKRKHKHKKAKRRKLEEEDEFEEEMSSDEEVSDDSDVDSDDVTSDVDVSDVDDSDDEDVSVSEEENSEEAESEEADGDEEEKEDLSEEEQEEEELSGSDPSLSPSD